MILNYIDHVCEPTRQKVVLIILQVAAKYTYSFLKYLSLVDNNTYQMLDSKLL